MPANPDCVLTVSLLLILIVLAPAPPLRLSPLLSLSLYICRFVLFSYERRRLARVNAILPALGINSIMFTKFRRRVVRRSRKRNRFKKRRTRIILPHDGALRLTLTRARRSHAFLREN